MVLVLLLQLSLLCFVPTYTTGNRALSAWATAAITAGAAPPSQSPLISVLEANVLGVDTA
eukprot:COSAG05_NODE_14051_length_409_cov_1.574194_1_plen_59_part_10